MVRFPLTQHRLPRYASSDSGGWLVQTVTAVRKTRRMRNCKTNHRFREIGVGILARLDSRETTSRLSRLFLFRRGTPPQNRSDSQGDFGVPGTRSRNDIAAIRLLSPARSGGRVLRALDCCPTVPKYVGISTQPLRRSLIG